MVRVRAHARARVRGCVGAWARVSVCACVRACGCVLSASAARLRTHRGHGTLQARHKSGELCSGRPNTEHELGRYLTEDYHNASALSGTTCALQSVNRAGKQTEKRTTYKGRTGHRNARTAQRTARSRQKVGVGQRAAGRVPDRAVPRITESACVTYACKSCWLTSVSLLPPGSARGCWSQNSRRF